MTKVRIVIAEKNPLFRETIRRVLERHSGCTIVAEVSSLAETAASISEHQPALVLLDLSLAPRGGFAALRRLSLQFPQTRFAALLSEYTPEYRSAVHAHGGFYCIAKDHLEEHLAWIITSIVPTV